MGMSFFQSLKEDLSNSVNEVVDNNSMIDGDGPILPSEEPVALGQNGSLFSKINKKKSISNDDELIKLIDQIEEDYDETSETEGLPDDEYSDEVTKTEASSDFEGYEEEYEDDELPDEYEDISADISEEANEEETVEEEFEIDTDEEDTEEEVDIPVSEIEDLMAMFSAELSKSKNTDSVSEHEVIEVSDEENADDDVTFSEENQEEYTEEEYAEEYSEDGYVEGEYSEEEYSEEEYSDEEYSEEEYSEDNYSEEYSEEAYSDQEYTEDDYSNENYEVDGNDLISQDEPEYSEESEGYSVRDALNSLKNASIRYEKENDTEPAEENRDVMDFVADIPDDVPEAADSIFANTEAVKEDGDREMRDINSINVEKKNIESEEEKSMLSDEEILSSLVAEYREKINGIEDENEEASVDVREAVLDELKSESSNEQPVTEEEIPSRPVRKTAPSFLREDSEMTDETAVISEGMTVRGNIESTGNLDLLGDVFGDITILGKLNIAGRVTGDTKANEVFIDGAEIGGNIEVNESVKIGQESVIIGNIKASSAVIAGAVKGDIDVHGPVILDSSAIIMGNIKSMSVQINNGAIVEGLCSQCYAPVNPSSFFDEFKRKLK